MKHISIEFNVPDHDCMMGDAEAGSLEGLLEHLDRGTPANDVLSAPAKISIWVSEA